MTLYPSAPRQFMCSSLFFGLFNAAWENVAIRLREIFCPFHVEVDQHMYFGLVLDSFNASSHMKIDLAKIPSFLPPPVEGVSTQYRRKSFFHVA